MKNKNIFKRFLTSLVMLIFLWIVFIITRIVFEEKVNNNLNYIPTNADFAVRVNAKELVESSLFSILFENQDDKIISKIKEAIEKKDDKMEKFQNNGVDYLSDIVVFSSPFKEGKVIGFALNISNHTLFKDKMSDLTNKNQLIEVIDNVGFILTYIAIDESTKLKKDDLSSFFNKNIKSISLKEKPKLISDSKSIFQIFTNGNVLGENTSFSKSTTQLKLIKTGLQLDGLLTISDNKIIPAKRILIPSQNDFHFYNSIIPKILQDTINYYCKKSEIIIPNLKSISFNYKGMNIVNDDSGMHFLPQIDLLIEFKNELSVSDLLKDSPLMKLIDAEYSDNQIKIAGQTYYIHQIDKSTVSIGITKTPSIGNNSKNELFSVKGNLSSVLKIEGGGLIMTLLEIVPAYKNSKELFKNVETFDIVIQKTTSKNAQLKGNLDFIKGHSALNEILKVLL